MAGGGVWVSPLVIGLTVVAAGTGSPEITFSLQAAAAGQGDLTLGNVIGSNIFNILAMGNPVQFSFSVFVVMFVGITFAILLVGVMRSLQTVKSVK